MNIANIHIWEFSTSEWSLNVYCIIQTDGDFLRFLDLRLNTPFTSLLDNTEPTLSSCMHVTTGTRWHSNHPWHHQRWQRGVYMSSLQWPGRGAPHYPSAGSRYCVFKINTLQVLINNADNNDDNNWTWKTCSLRSPLQLKTTCTPLKWFSFIIYTWRHLL